MPVTFHNLQLCVLPYSYIENNALPCSLQLFYEFLLANFSLISTCFTLLFLVLIGYKCFLFLSEYGLLLELIEVNGI